MGQDERSIDDDFDDRWNGAFIPQELWHFHQTLLDRYDIVFAPGDYSDLRRAIKDGRANVAERRKDGTTIFWHRVRSCDAMIFVLARGSMIITAWPPERRLWRKVTPPGQ